MPPVEMTQAQRRGAMTRRISYQKVVLSVYAMGDKYNIMCPATDAELARDSGRSVSTVRRVLREMVAKGLVGIMSPADGALCRNIVFLDNPGGQGYLADFRAEPLELRWARRKRWLKMRREWKQKAQLS